MLALPVPNFKPREDFKGIVKYLLECCFDPQPATSDYVLKKHLSPKILTMDQNLKI